MYDNNSGLSSNFAFEGTYNCWIENVESNFSDADQVEIDYSTHDTVADSYFHDSFIHTSGTTRFRVGPAILFFSQSCPEQRVQAAARFGDAGMGSIGQRDCL